MTTTTLNYEALFKLFCYDSESRPNICKPFKQNGLYVALDIHTLICLPVQFANLNYEEQEKPNVSKLLPAFGAPYLGPPSKEINVAQLESLLVPDLIEEKNLIQKAEICEECEGEGEVEWSYSAGETSNNKTFERVDDCPICNGSGNSLPDRWQKTGRQIPDGNKNFKLLGVGFADKQLRRLITAAKMICVETITKTHGDTRNPNLFKVGNFTILIMPVLLSGQEVHEINL